jgi:hypothetical protein
MLGKTNALLNHYSNYPQLKEVSMTCSKAVVTFLLIILFAGCSTPPQKNKIEGVWELISQKWNGKGEISGRDIKVITDKHFSFIFQDTAEAKSLLAKKTLKDSLSAFFDDLYAGAGSYKLVDSIYTETIEFFSNPEHIGQSTDFIVRVDGDRLYQSGKWPTYKDGKKVKDVFLEEVYKRIE